MATVFAYYKGTPVQYCLKRQSSFNAMKSLGNEMIVAGLKSGETVKQLIDIYTSQLDQMEEKMFLFQEHGGSDRVCVLTGTEKTLWFANISALIKLKAINDDNMNGFMVVE